MVEKKENKFPLCLFTLRVNTLAQRAHLSLTTFQKSRLQLLPRQRFKAFMHEPSSSGGYSEVSGTIIKSPHLSDYESTKKCISLIKHAVNLTEMIG